MAAIFRRRAELPDAGTLEQMANHHLLLLPSETATPELVATLVRSRVDDSDLDFTGQAKVGRRSRITGPIEIGPADSEAFGVPSTWRTAYLLETPEERDADGFDGFVDPEQMALWMRAFPDGPPYREEGDLIGLGLDLARRLGGGVRISGTGVVMKPDPTRDIERTVWSPYWVEPQDLVDLLAPVLPGARRDLGRPHQQAATEDEIPWDIDPLDPLGDALEEALTPELMECLEEVAAASDAWATQELELTDGYAVTGHGGIVVGVHLENRVPGWVLRQLADLPDVPTDRLVVYDIRWWPEDLAQLHIENPTPAHRIARRIVGEIIRQVARVTAETVYGVVVDSSGFHVRPESLR